MLMTDVIYPRYWLNVGKYLWRVTAPGNDAELWTGNLGARRDGWRTGRTVGEDCITGKPIDAQQAAKFQRDSSFEVWL
jgi:hypothetical protein